MSASDNQTGKPLAINAELALTARTQIQDQIGKWLMKLLEYPGYRDWKNRDLQERILLAMMPDHEIEETTDFKFDAVLEQQIDLVAGYHNLISASQALRQTEMYFRRFPFRNGEVGREDHLKTCCELLFSRVYHFRERLLKFLVQLDRKTEPRKTLPHAAIKDDFDKRFRLFLDERHNINHHTGYSDIQMGAIGLTDLLATADQELAWMRASAASYRKVTKAWVAKTRIAAEHVDLYAGLVARLMLMRCDFLRPSGDHNQA